MNFNASLPIGVLCVTAMTLAVPAYGQGKDPRGVNPAHYQCYRVGESEGFKPLDVKLADQFGASGAKVLKPVMLCAPTSKNGAAVKDQKTHLVCYEDEGPKPVDRKAKVLNQFGTSVLAVGGPTMLCVPSLKSLQK